MTRDPIHLASDPKVWRRVVGLVVLLAAGAPLVYSAIVVPLSPREQAFAAVAMIAFALVASFSRPLRPLIIFLSCFASIRYFYWRVTSTVNMETVADQTMSFALLGAETYGLLILFLGYFQTIEVERRRAPRPTRHPSVDVFIPTYNEPIEVVRRTVIGALAMDYPAKTVHLLDDGDRPELRAMAEELGVRYLARKDN
jgi:cellulose synthase (UDP-forming)